MDAEMKGRIETTVRKILQESNMDEVTESKIRKQAAKELDLDLSQPQHKAFVKQVVESFIQEKQEEQEEEEENSQEETYQDQEYDDEGNPIICRVPFLLPDFSLWFLFNENSNNDYINSFLLFSIFSFQVIIMSPVLFLFPRSPPFFPFSRGELLSPSLDFISVDPEKVVASGSLSAIGKGGRCWWMVVFALNDLVNSQWLSFSNLLLFKPYTRIPTLLPAMSIVITNSSRFNFTLDNIPITHPNLYGTDSISIYGMTAVLDYSVCSYSFHRLPPPTAAGNQVSEVLPPSPSPSEGILTQPFMPIKVPSDSACSCTKAPIVFLIICGVLAFKMQKNPLHSLIIMVLFMK